MRSIWLLIILLTTVTWAQPDPPTPSEQEAGFLFRQGLKLHQEGQTGRATELFKKALRLEPERLEIRPYLARALYAGGDFEAALRQLELYLNLEPDDSKVGLFRVQTLVALERYGQAKDALSYLSVVHEDKTWQWHNLNGFLLEADEKPAEAEKEYLRAADLAPDEEFEPRANLITLLLKQERVEEATAIVTQMLSEASDDPRVLNAFALLLSKQERGFDPSSLLEAVKDQSTPFELQYNLAAALAERQETGQAALLAADLVDRFEEEPRASWLYGRILLQQRELQDAGEYLLAALDQLPTSDETLQTMGTYSYLTGDYEEAANWFEQALTRAPESAEVAHNLSLAYSRLDQLTKAIEASLAAVRLRTDDPRFVYQLAFVLDRDGELTRAARYYRMFLELNEDAEEAAIVREHLEEIEGSK